MRRCVIHGPCLRPEGDRAKSCAYQRAGGEQNRPSACPTPFWPPRRRRSSISASAPRWTSRGVLAQGRGGRPSLPAPPALRRPLRDHPGIPGRLLQLPPARETHQRTLRRPRPRDPPARQRVWLRRRPAGRDHRRRAPPDRGTRPCHLIRRRWRTRSPTASSHWRTATGPDRDASAKEPHASGRRLLLCPYRSKIGFGSPKQSVGHDHIGSRLHGFLAPPDR